MVGESDGTNCRPVKAPAREPLCWRAIRCGTAGAALAGALLGLVWATAGCGFPGTSRPVEESGIVMDTFVRVRAYGPGAADAVEAALGEFRRLDALLNPYVESSELAAVNRAAGSGAVRVSPETFEVVERALWYAGRAGGLFDPTIFPLVKAWDFAGTPHVPSRRELDDAVRLVDYRKVVLDRANCTVALVEKGMGLDLGGIAKGYATDRAVATLRASGVKSALIDAGGNVYALGVKPSGILGAAPWVVGIQHPRTSGETIATAMVSGESVVTSGDYQRYFESGGVRYHHILDPSTGYPARGFQSVTIIGPSSVDCDALSTSVFVMGEEAGFRLLKDSTGFSAVAVRSDGTVVKAGAPREGIEVTSSRPGS